MLFATSQLAPPATLDPSGVWFFNWVIPIAGSVFIVLAVADVIRRRRLTWGFLFLFNSLAVYWMETIGDWGQMLFYSPAFAQHHLLEWLPIKTPNDPLFMPFAYAVYWGVHAILVLWLSQWVSARFGWSMLKSMVVLAIPVNYVWDFAVEGTATAMGWWTYDPGIGPVLQWGNGGRITLLWTIGIMCVWPNLSPTGPVNHRFAVSIISSDSAAWIVSPSHGPRCIRPVTPKVEAGQPLLPSNRS